MAYALLGIYSKKVSAFCNELMKFGLKIWNGSHGRNMKIGKDDDVM